MNLTELIRHPERMDRETLYDLRGLLALHPYYQAARLLMLHNLYLLHDPTFDEELRRAAAYIGDRRVLFNLVEAAHYRLRPAAKQAEQAPQPKPETANRTTELIDSFLGSLPADEEEPKPKGRKPTPADAAVDYVAYLIESGQGDDLGTTPAPAMKGQSLIDDFISREGRIVLPEMEESPSEQAAKAESRTPVPDDLCTEAMAQIYVRQGRFAQAREILRRIDEAAPGKNPYHADQMRFLDKLIKNSNAKARQ